MCDTASISKEGECGRARNRVNAAWVLTVLSVMLNDQFFQFSDGRAGLDTEDHLLLELYLVLGHLGRPIPQHSYFTAAAFNVDLHTALCTMLLGENATKS